MLKSTLFMLVAASLLPAQRLDRWRIIGPGGGGAQFYPTISPHDPARVLVACDMTGSYLTHDGGASWRMFNLRGTTRFFLFDPVNPDVLYARGIGLWRSTNTGKSWALVHPNPATVTGVHLIGDHAGERIVSTGSPQGSLLALAIDPADSRTLYAAFQEGPRVGLYLSTDWGAAWKRLADLPGGARQIYVDPRSPRQDRTLAVIGAASVSVRQGGQWRHGPPPEGVTRFTDVSAGFPDQGPLVVYAITETVAFVSEDAGASWRRLDFLGSAARLRAVATSLHHPATAYLSFSGLRLDDGTYFGVAKTADRGRTFELLWKASAKPAPNYHDAWLSETFGPGWGGPPFSLGVAPNDPGVCYGTDYGRTMRTTDGGKTWRAAYSKRAAEGGWVSTGLDVTTCYGVHFDPFDSRRVFISYTDIGLFRSEDGGASWLASTNGVPRPWRNTTYWVVFDPAVRGRMWGVMSGTHDLPRPKMWRDRSPSAYQGGVSISEDGGRNWHASIEGMPPTAATHILLDERSPVDARVLYVAGFGRGVFKSADGGRSWSLKNEGLPGEEPFAWRLAQDREGVLYLVVARRNERAGPGDPGGGALYRSTDGAESWSAVALPSGVNGPNGLAIDPEDPKCLYLAAWGRYASTGDVDGGIFLSTDGGASWRNVLSRDQHVYDVTIDPRNPKVLYASGFSSSAWRSTDRGLSWQRLRGFNFKWGHRVIPDPRDAAKVYITTFGGSVWHGPAAGDPNAPEDIATPILAHPK